MKIIIENLCVIWFLIKILKLVFLRGYNKDGMDDNDLDGIWNKLYDNEFLNNIKGV